MDLATAIDIHDYPPCLRRVRVAFWRKPPTENGDSVPYDTFENGEPRAGEPQWCEVEPATGSDYSGGTVSLANFRELQRLLGKCEDWSDAGPAWCTAYGALGTYGLFVVYERLPAELRAIVDGLDDYRLMSEEVLSELETELGDKAWSQSGRQELRTALEARLGLDGLTISDEQLVDLFRVACERVGHGWEFQESAEPYFDFARAAREVVAVLPTRKRPGWLDERQHAALDLLRSAARQRVAR